MKKLDSNLYTLYKKTHRKTGLKYLGYTGAKDPHAYPGSGKDWTPHLEEHGYDYDTEILFQSENKEEIRPKGIYYSKLWNIVKSKEWANKTIEEGYGGWADRKTTGLVSVKDSNGKTSQVSINDPRYLNGELVGVAKGTITVVDDSGNKLRVSNTDPRYLSGELVGVSKGLMMAKDKDGNNLRIDKTDPRYLSGELVGVAKGTITVVDKLGNNLRISKTDPRYLSGELVGVAKGRIKVKDSFGNIKYIVKTDPRVISGEFIKVSK